jgi:uncharacterized membrane protein
MLAVPRYSWSVVLAGTSLMNIRRSFLVASALLASVGTTAAMAQSIVSLGFGTGGLDRINPSGTTVVGGNVRVTLSPLSQQSFPYPAVYSVNAVANDGVSLAGNILNSGANGLSNEASIAGRYSGGVWNEVPVISTAVAAFGEISSGMGISGDGRFVTGITWEPAGRIMAYLYDNNNPTAAIRLGSVSNVFFTGSKASGVNGDGSVVIGNDFNPDPDGSNTRLAAVWRRDAITGEYIETVLDTNVEFGNGELYDVNEAGNVLVGTSTDVLTGGARWNWNGSSYVRTAIPEPVRPIDVSAEAELRSIIPYGVSEDGNTIVGTVTWSAGFFERYSHAFIWTAADGSRVLRDVVAAANPDAPGLSQYPRLGAATSISADGTKIVGHGGDDPFAFFGKVWVLDMATSAPTPPTIISTPENQLISNCGLFGMSVGVAGTGPFTYQWQRNGVDLTDETTPWGSMIFGATSDRLRIMPAGVQDVGTYTCIITAFGGVQLTVTATASLDPAFPAPVNDTCAGAIEVGEGLTQQVMCGAYVDQFLPGCAPADARTDMFFRYTPTFTGNARIDACGSEFDTNLSVTSSCGGVLLACNDNADSGPSCNPNTAARIGSMPVTAGVPVIIRVGAGSYPIMGTNGRINLNITVAPPTPANDLCINAQDITLGTHEFDNTEATTDGVVPCNEFSGRDLWYRYTPPETGSIFVSTCGTTVLNTVLSVHSSCGGAVLACNDNAFDFENGCTYASRIDAAYVQAGVPVLIRVASADASYGDTGLLNLAFTAGPGYRCVSDIVDASGAAPGDGTVDGSDFIAFINSFGIGDASVDPLADIAGGGDNSDQPDGTIDGSDFIAFINAFGSGC